MRERERESGRVRVRPFPRERSEERGNRASDRPKEAIQGKQARRRHRQTAWLAGWLLLRLAPFSQAQMSRLRLPPAPLSM